MFGFGRQVRRLLSSAFIIASSGSVAYIIQTNFIGLCKTEGVSMIPTIDEGATVLVDRRVPKLYQQLKNGDVVLLRSMPKPGELVIKRIEASEGDRMPQSVEIDRYLKHSNRLTVPTGHIWISGDNKNNSHDSRDYGPVPVSLVSGKVIYQISPTIKRIASSEKTAHG